MKEIPDTEDDPDDIGKVVLHLVGLDCDHLGAKWTSS